MARKRKNLTPNNIASNFNSGPPKSFHEGIAAFQSGDYKQAKVLFKRLHKSNPKQPDILYFLSLIASRQKDSKEAKQKIVSALKFNKHHPGYLCQYADVLRDENQLDKAIDFYRNSIKHDQNYFDSWNNLGMTLKLKGSFQDAIKAYQKALEINPDIAEVYNNIANIYVALGDDATAITYFEKGVEKNPYFAGIYFNISKSFLNLSEFEKALEAIRNAVHFEPNNEYFIRELAKIFSQLRIDQKDETIEKDLLLCLDAPKEDAWSFGQTVADYLIKFTSLKEVFDLVNNNENFHIKDIDTNILLQPLLITFLSNQQSCNIYLEQFLTYIRKNLLFDISSDNEFNYFNNLESFVISLALQCFINEYVFYITDEEKTHLEKIEHEIFKQNNEFNVVKLLIYSCYRPLYKHNENSKILELQESLPKSLAPLIKQQLIEPFKEIALRNSIPSLGTTNDEISKIVREQYEDNPYPRWFNIELPEAKPMEYFLKDLFPYLDSNTLNFPEKMQILVAGCGTGLQPIRNARYFPKSQIVGIDLSLSSLSYANRMLEELNVNNVDLYQGDILEVEKTNLQFDFIECYGVLHHMDDPLFGWKKLYEQLNVGGVMRIALYSYKARSSIRAANKFIQDNKYASTPEGIRKCRKDIFKLPDSHELRQFDHSPDFYTISECRDLIFHVNEHQLDIPFIQNALEDMNLTFLGFDLNHKLAMADFKKMNPNIEDLRDLNKWHEFELAHPLTFSSQYIFWVQK